MSTGEQFFSRAMKSKSDDELRDIIKDKVGYVLEARNAAFSELNTRGTEEGQDDFASMLQEENSKKVERESKERTFLKIPKEAPTIMKVIGYYLYGALIFGIIVFFVGAYLSNVVLSGFFTWLFLLVFLFLTLLLTDALIKGNRWARMIFTVLTGIGLLNNFGIISIQFMVTPDESSGMTGLEILSNLTSLTILILLYIEPCKSWFEGKKKHSSPSDLLDQL